MPRREMNAAIFDLADSVKAPDRFGRIPGGTLTLRGVDVLLHPVLGYREKLGLQAGPFLLAAGKNPDIIPTVLVLVEKLNLCGTPNGLLFSGCLNRIRSAHERTA